MCDLCYAPYIIHDQQWLSFSAAQQWSHSLALFGCVCVLVLVLFFFFFEKHEI